MQFQAPSLSHGPDRAPEELELEPEEDPELADPELAPEEEPEELEPEELELEELDSAAGAADWVGAGALDSEEGEASAKIPPEPSEPEA